jgi:hypothetical protein
MDRKRLHNWCLSSGGPGLHTELSIEELKGAADFIYETIGEKK